MLTQVDCWESPTSTDVADAMAAIPTLYAWQGYTPGWGAPYGGGWSVSGVQAVLQGLGRYLPLLVPASGDPASTPQDAQGWDVAVAITRNHIQAAGGLFLSCGLDVEAGWSAAYPAGWRAAAFAFALACLRADVASVVYGSPAFISSLAGAAAPSVIYPGEWPNGANAPGTVPDLAQIPGIPDSAWTGPGQRIWQYQGGHSVAGLSLQVDASVTTAEVPYCRPALAPPSPTPSVPVVLAPGTYTDSGNTFVLTIH